MLACFACSSRDFRRTSTRSSPDSICAFVSSWNGSFIHVSGETSNNLPIDSDLLNLLLRNEVIIRDGVRRVKGEMNILKYILGIFWGNVSCKIDSFVIEFED